MKIFICLLFIFVSTEAKNETKKCAFMIMANCARGLGKFAKEHSFIIPTNEKEIAEQCENFQEVKNCMYNFGETCMTAMDRIIGNFILSGTNQQTKDFCNSSHQYYKDYLEGLPCIKDNFGHVSSCYEDELASLEYMYQEDSFGNKFSAFCCGINRLKKCLLDPFENKCNKNIEKLVELQLLLFTAGEFVMGMCEPYSLEECLTLPTKADYKDQFKNHYFIEYASPFVKN